MQSLGNIINLKTKRSPMMRGVVASMAVEKANHILANMFGENIIDFARAIFIKDKSLTIACLSSVASQEIRMQEAKLIAEINEKMGSDVVHKVKFLT